MKASIKRSILSLIVFAAASLIFSSCDTFKEDALPVQQFNELDLVVLPNSSTIVNLKEGLESFGTITISPAKEPTFGSLSSLSNTIVKYQATSTFSKGQSDQFTYNVFNQANQLLGQRTYNVNLTSDTTDLPCGVYSFPDSVAIAQNQPITINVLDNDVFCSVNQGDLVFGMDLPAANGLTEIDYPVIRYYPSTVFRGRDQFVYTLMDKNKVYSSALVTISVGGSDLCPFKAIDDKYDLTDSTQLASYRLPVQLNDQKCNSTITGFAIKSGAQSGTASISGDKLIYSPRANSTGLDSVRYEICSATSGLCSQATVIIKLKD